MAFTTSAAAATTTRTTVNRTTSTTTTTTTTMRTTTATLVVPCALPSSSPSLSPSPSSTSRVMAAARALWHRYKHSPPASRAASSMSAFFRPELGIYLRCHDDDKSAICVLCLALEHDGDGGGNGGGGGSHLFDVVPPSPASDNNKDASDDVARLERLLTSASERKRVHARVLRCCPTSNLRQHLIARHPQRVPDLELLLQRLMKSAASATASRTATSSSARHRNGALTSIIVPITSTATSTATSSRPSLTHPRPSMSTFDGPPAKRSCPDRNTNVTASSTPQAFAPTHVLSSNRQLEPLTAPRVHAQSAAHSSIAPHSSSSASIDSYLDRVARLALRWRMPVAMFESSDFGTDLIRTLHAQDATNTASSGAAASSSSLIDNTSIDSATVHKALLRRSSAQRARDMSPLSRSRAVSLVLEPFPLRSHSPTYAVYLLAALDSPTTTTAPIHVAFHSLWSPSEPLAALVQRIREEHVVSALSIVVKDVSGGLCIDVDSSDGLRTAERDVANPARPIVVPCFVQLLHCVAQRMLEHPYFSAARAASERLAVDGADWRQCLRAYRAIAPPRDMSDRSDDRDARDDDRTDQLMDMLECVATAVDEISSSTAAATRSSSSLTLVDALLTLRRLHAALALPGAHGNGGELTLHTDLAELVPSVLEASLASNPHKLDTLATLALAECAAFTAESHLPPMCAALFAKHAGVPFTESSGAALAMWFAQWSESHLPPRCSIAQEQVRSAIATSSPESFAATVAQETSMARREQFVRDLLVAGQGDGEWQEQQPCWFSALREQCLALAPSSGDDSTTVRAVWLSALQRLRRERMASSGSGGGVAQVQGSTPDYVAVAALTRLLSIVPLPTAIRSGEMASLAPLVANAGAAAEEASASSLSLAVVEGRLRLLLDASRAL